jgi:hypothetical protein
VQVVGVELAPAFVKFAGDAIKPEHKANATLINGDACRLNELLHEHAPANMWDKIRIVVCLNNTMNIMPTFVRESVLQEMLLCAGNGPGSCAVFGYWRGDMFKQAVQAFYKVNPALCGEFSEEEHVNYEARTLSTPTGYESQWMNLDEIKAFFAKFPLDILHCHKVESSYLVQCKHSSSKQVRCDSL